MSEPITILIADDHPIVREGLATVLSQEDDLNVIGQAKNGVEAVAMAKRLKPSVILMDLQMPEMNGVDAIKAIKQAEPDIGVIILTTFDTDEYIFSGIEAGAQAFLLKDSPPEEVLKAIRAVNDGNSLIQPSVARRLLDRFSEISRNPPASEPSKLLTPREIEVLQLVSKGASNKVIASELFIGESTVKTHIIHIFNKLDVKDRTQAVAHAARKGIIQL